MRSIESAVRFDFDDLYKGLLTSGNSYVIRGFELEIAGSIGSSATGLQLIVDDSAILHGNASVAGTQYVVEPGTSNEVLNSNTNTRVDGSFVPGTVNYIGLDFERTPDSSTVSQTYFWNVVTKTEFTKNVPQSLTLNYVIVISSSPFTSEILPIATVLTDSSNNVVEVTDARNILGRLGSGGSSPNPFYVYPWTAQTEGRVENPPSSTSSSVSPFRGGDKQLFSLKDWMDAVMTEFLEIKGTPYWYSQGSGGSILKLRADAINTIFTGSGVLSHDGTTAGKLNWSSDVFLTFIGGRLKYKISSNVSTSHIVLADNQVAYLNLVRDISISPNLIFTNGSSTVTSVGSVSWTSGLVAGDFVKKASDSDSGYYKILTVDSSSQVTLSENYQGTSTGATGNKSKYAWGVYGTNATPSTDRHIYIANRENVSFDQDTYWLFFRDDNASLTPRIYARLNGNSYELEQGESREISDGQSLQVLQYIGSPDEKDSTPNYTDAVVTSVAEVTTFTFPPASALTSGQSFTMNSSGDVFPISPWINKDSLGGNPNTPGFSMLEIPVTTGDTNIQVATSFYNEIINYILYFTAVDNLDGTVTVTNLNVGEATDAANVDMGVGFAISVDTQGAGNYNKIVSDGDNLTKSIKKLDEELGDLIAASEQKEYKEIIEIVSGAPVDDNEMTGPVIAGTDITIPLNARHSDIQEVFIVGDGKLDVYLNGVKQVIGEDYNEVGTTGNSSSKIEFLFDLIVTDVIDFRKTKVASGGSSSGGGGAVTGQNLGTAEDADVYKQTVSNTLQFRRLEAGSNVTIVESANKITIASSAGVALNTVSTYAVNTTITPSDDVILANTAGGNVTITLPSALGNTGKEFKIKNIGANIAYVATILNQLIDGTDCTVSPYQMTLQYESVSLVCDGTQWFIL